MKIERVDENTVKCFLSNEELKEQEVTFKDFLTKSQKAKDLVERIIIKAEEEVGYKPPQFAFDMQIMVLPEKGVVLTLSESLPEDVRNNPNFMQYLNEMKKLLESHVTGQQTATPGQIPDFVVFVFGNLWKVISYAQILPRKMRVNSSLYKHDGYYYLILRKGAASYERYSRCCIHAMEYAAIYSAREDSVSFLEEHGEVILAEKAISKLQKMQDKQ